VARYTFGQRVAAEFIGSTALAICRWLPAHAGSNVVTEATLAE
jgi:hypothetical protein